MKIAVTWNSPEGEFFLRRGHPAHEKLMPYRVEDVLTCLRAAGHEAEAIDADVHLVERLTAFFADGRELPFPGLVFNLAYGLQGGSRYCHVPAVLELLGLPYIGSDILAHALASDKITAKRVFRARGLNTPEFEVFRDDHAEPEDGKELLPDVEHKVVVKPAGEAASEGLYLVSDGEQLHEAVEQDLIEFGGPILAERFLPGRELNVAVLGNDPIQTLPPVEVVTRDSPLFDFQAKHTAGAYKLICPAPLPAETLQQARNLAVGAFTALRCRDWGRVDIRLDENGRLYILEMNTIPGIGDQSSFLTAARSVGIDGLNGLVSQLIDIAVKRYEKEVAGPSANGAVG